MRDYIEARVLDIADYILATNATVRRCAQRFGVSKTTVHKDMRERLPRVSPALAAPVARVLLYNKLDRHIRGGNATRLKYLKRRQAERDTPAQGDSVDPATRAFPAL